MQIERDSPCKVNLLLNILGKRADGFHELETLFYPIQYCDRIAVRGAGSGINLSCSDPTLGTDSGNLVYRAAREFQELTGIRDGVEIHLEKRIPLAAGLGGGSGNAATTLLALNDLFQCGLPAAAFQEPAARLGSDVPFFLQPRPALAFGRGERVTELERFSLFDGMQILLVHPGFGISTPWAYKSLMKFPAALNGTPGRAQKLAESLSSRPDADLKTTSGVSRLGGIRDQFYNSLEAPALYKYPILKIYQEAFLEEHAEVTLMSGSGSTTFAIFASRGAAELALERFCREFGTTAWTAIVPL